MAHSVAARTMLCVSDESQLDVQSKCTLAQLYSFVHMCVRPRTQKCRLRMYLHMHACMHARTHMYTRLVLRGCDGCQLCSLASVKANGEAVINVPGIGQRTAAPNEWTIEGQGGTYTVVMRPGREGPRSMHMTDGGTSTMVVRHV